jgi:hypothetical protein
MEISLRVKCLLIFMMRLYGQCLQKLVRAEDRPVWDYSRVQNWHYDTKMEVVILMPEDFVEARNYYFYLKKYPERHKTTAFTAWHRNCSFQISYGN